MAPVPEEAKLELPFHPPRPRPPKVRVLLDRATARIRGRGRPHCQLSTPGHPSGSAHLWASTWPPHLRKGDGRGAPVPGPGSHEEMMGAGMGVCGTVHLFRTHSQSCRRPLGCSRARRSDPKGLTCRTLGTVAKGTSVHPGASQQEQKGSRQRRREWRPGEKPPARRPREGTCASQGSSMRGPLPTAGGTPG